MCFVTLEEKLLAFGKEAFPSRAPAGYLAGTPFDHLIVSL